MKRILTTLVAIIAIAQFSHAQWLPNGSDIYFNTGRVGIGISSPASSLHVMGTGTFSNSIVAGSATLNTLGLQFTDVYTGYFNGTVNNSGLGFSLKAYHGIEMTNGTGVVARFGSSANTLDSYFNGNVGIGTTSPSALIDVRKNGSGYTGVFYNTNATGEGVTIRAGSTSSQNALVVQTYDGNTALFNVRSDGNVGIGTTAPDAKLTVNGTIHSKEVKVDTSIPVPDYVFEPTYKLPQLSELKTYLDANHHLPEIPSAAELTKNGLNLSEMNLKLLKKVEELTLYLIEKDAELKDLKTSQQQQLDEIKAQLKISRKKPNQ